MNVSCLCTSLHLMASNDIGGAAGFMFLFQSELLSLPKFTYVSSSLTTVLQLVVFFIGLAFTYVVRLFLWTLYFSFEAILTL